MAFPLGVLLTWLGIAGLWVSFHRTGATTPWGVYQEILGKGEAAAGAGGSDGAKPATSGQLDANGNPSNGPGNLPSDPAGIGNALGDLIPGLKQFSDNVDNYLGTGIGSN